MFYDKTKLDEDTYCGYGSNNKLDTYCGYDRY